MKCKFHERFPVLYTNIPPTHIGPAVYLVADDSSTRTLVGQESELAATTSQILAA